MDAADFAEKATRMTEKVSSKRPWVSAACWDRADRYFRIHAPKSPRIARATAYWNRAGCPKAATKRLPPTHRPTLAARMLYNAPHRMGLAFARRGENGRAVPARSGKVGVATDSAVMILMVPL